MADHARMWYSLRDFTIPSIVGKKCQFSVKVGSTKGRKIKKTKSNMKYFSNMKFLYASQNIP